MVPTLAVLAALTLAQQTDTTLAVGRGARLNVNNFEGEIVVRAWNESRVRVRATHSSRDLVSISASESVVRVQSTGRRGPARMVEYEITVPAWMAVSLSGLYTDITVSGVQADVSAETVEGSVELDGGSGTIQLKSIEGGVTVRNARGRITVSSVEGDIRLTGVAADITAESVDGAVFISATESAAVDASTVDGDITYLGPIKDGGRYSLSTHDGNVTVAVAERTNATFTVATFDGEFDASFPVRLQDTRARRRFSFTVGNGSARVELETFDGEIRLRRPGEIPAPERNPDRRNGTHESDHGYDH